jgi:DNA-binding response OmpR family regulator
MKTLILEDNENRINWFQQRFTDITMVDFARTAEEGIKLVQENIYSLIFLDHDLGDRIFVDSNDPNTGYQVAKAIVETDNKGAQIIIHSMNPGGANAIKSLLPNATYVPFCFLKIEGGK